MFKFIEISMKLMIITILLLYSLLIVVVLMIKISTIIFCTFQSSYIFIFCSLVIVLKILYRKNTTYILSVVDFCMYEVYQSQRSQCKNIPVSYIHVRSIKNFYRGTGGTEVRCVVFIDNKLTGYIWHKKFCITVNHHIIVFSADNNV